MAWPSSTTSASCRRSTIATRLSRRCASRSATSRPKRRLGRPSRPAIGVQRQSLDNALLDRCRELGVDVRTNAEAKRLVEQGSSFGVEVDGEVLQPRAIVAADGIRSRLRTAGRAGWDAESRTLRRHRPPAAHGAAARPHRGLLRARLRGLRHAGRWQRGQRCCAAGPRRGTPARGQSSGRLPGADPALRLSAPSTGCWTSRSPWGRFPCPHDDSGATTSSWQATLPAPSTRSTARA